MIDTDKYEGHTEGPWRYYDDEEHDCWVFEGEDIEAQARVAFFAFTPCEGIAYLDDPDLNLMIDAPLILQAYEKERDYSAELAAHIFTLKDEVKRLREQSKLMVDYFRFMRDGGFTDADWRTVNEWIGDEEE